MDKIKLERINGDIRMKLSTLFTELKDPRVSKMLSIIKLNVSNDLSHCKVYVSAVEGKEKTLESVEGLKSAQGFIRREVAKSLNLRKTPEFHFIADDSLEYSANINKIIDEL